MPVTQSPSEPGLQPTVGASNVIEMHEHADEFKGSMGCDVVLRARRAAPRRHDQPKQGRDVLAGATHDPAMKPTAHFTLPWLIFFSLDR
jgi:hypothetical protein